MTLLLRFYKFLGLPGSVLLAVSVALGVMLGLETLSHNRTRNALNDTQWSLDIEKAAHRATVQNYRIAAELARRLDAENQARVAKEQRVITERIERDYQARLADARADAERLRQQLKARTRGGPAGSPPVPGNGPAPGGPDGSPEEDGFSINDRLIATEQAIQLDELQRWVREQVKVDLTGAGSSSRSPSVSR